MDEGIFPYCSCHPSNKEILKHSNFNEDGCYYIDKIFSTYNVKRLALYLKEYELWDIGLGWNELKQWGIENGDLIHEHFIQSNQFGKKFDTMIPMFICKKVDDEFEHQIKMKLKKTLFNGYNHKFTIENGRSFQAWAVLNTDNENTKIIGQIVAWKKL
jgi:glycyl-tRNA synthetase alpha subunit